MITGPYKIVKKGWGREEWLANGPAYCGKILSFNPGKRCSLHYHQRKVETLVCIAGVVRVEIAASDYGETGALEVYDLRRGDQVTIQPYQAHRFIGDTFIGGTLVEISTQHFEDDSVRVERGD